jgi:hypothetical protein
MMNEKQLAASELRHFLEIFRREARLEECRRLVQLEEKLREVGDLEHAAKDAEARIAATATAEAIQNDALDYAKKVRSDSKKEADDIIARALEEQDRLLSVARADADGIRVAADSYREAEHLKARHAEHQARAVVGGHEAELTKVAEARAERNREEAKTAEVRAERDRLQQEMDALKEQRLHQ